MSDSAKLSKKSKKPKKKLSKRKKKANQLRQAMVEYDEQVFSHPSSTQATTTPTLRQNTLEKAVFTPLPSPSKRIQVRFEHVNPDTLIKRNVAKTRRGGKKKRRRTRKKRKRRKTRKRKRRRRRKGGVAAGFLGEQSCGEVRTHPMFNDCCELDKADLRRQLRRAHRHLQHGRDRNARQQLRQQQQHNYLQRQQEYFQQQGEMKEEKGPYNIE
jgi:hypothetical protein